MYFFCCFFFQVLEEVEYMSAHFLNAIFTIGFMLFSYKWKRNGIDFNPSGNDERVVQLPNQGTLVFNAPEDKDEGIFQCFVDNGYGVAVSYTVNFREAKLARFPYEARKVGVSINVC